MSVVHKFELKDGKIFFDGMRIKGVRECHFSKEENNSPAELLLKIDVRTLGNDGIPEFDNSLDETRKKAGKEKTIETSDGRIGEIKEFERQYVNQAYSLVTVSFQIPCHDWKQLKKSVAWQLLEKHLEEIRNKYNQKSR